MIQIQDTFNDVIRDVITHVAIEDTFWVYVGNKKLTIKVTSEGDSPIFHCENLEFKSISDTRFLIKYSSDEFSLRASNWSFKEQASRLSSIAASGNSFTVGAQEGFLFLFPSSSMPFKVLEGHYSDVSCITYFPSTKVLLSGSTDMTIRLWDCESGNNARTFIKHKGEVTSLKTIGQFGRNFVSGSKDGMVNLWECNSGSCIHTFNIGAAVNSLLIASDVSSQTDSYSSELEFELAGKWLVVGDEKGFISIWDLIKKELISRTQIIDSPVVNLSQTDREILAVFQNGTICRLELDSKKYSIINIASISSVSCACFYEDTLVVAFEDCIVRLKQNEKEFIVTEFLVGVEQGSSVIAMAFNDGLYVACKLGNIYKFEA